MIITNRPPRPRPIPRNPTDRPPTTRLPIGATTVRTGETGPSTILPVPHSGRGRPPPPAPNTQPKEDPARPLAGREAQAPKCWDPNLGPPQLFSRGCAAAATRSSRYLLDDCWTLYSSRCSPLIDDADSTVLAVLLYLVWYWYL